jgi:tetratricopeptide (TPR) repeat protein
MELSRARGYSKQSGVMYEEAVGKYRDLIARNKDDRTLRFELGFLYYTNGRFQEAIEEFKHVPAPQAKKLSAIAQFKIGNYADALEIFRKEPSLDDEYLFYYGLTSERLNLFDKALEAYQKVQSPDFRAAAQERIGVIEKKNSRSNIKDVDPRISEMLAGAPKAEAYPQAGAFILYADEKTEVTPSNTEVTALHYLVKILNERGKEKFSEIHVDYDSTDEKVDLEYARTIKPDGSVVEVGSRHIRDVSKYLNFPLYSNARVFIISFPEITEGASIEYKLKIHRNQLINKKDFITGYPVQSSEPVINATFSLSVPKDKKVNLKILNEPYNSFNARLEPVIEEKGEARIYRWDFKDVPQILPESNMPPYVEINPTILVSSFQSWQEIYEWWWPLAKDKIKADDAIRQKVSELTHGIKEDAAKMAVLYNFCAQNIRYVAVEYGDAGYEPHKAEDIFRNKYGDCKDQAILLVTLLKEAGFSAWPLLIATTDYFNLNNDFPAVLFNHCIAAVQAKDSVVFLDPTAETCSFGDLPPGDQDRNIFLVKEDGYTIMRTPFYPPEHNRLQNDVRIRVGADEGIGVEKAIVTHGFYDQSERYWLLYTPPQLVREAIEERIQDISIGAQLVNYTVKNMEALGTPVELRYAFRGPEYFTAAGNLRIMPQLASMDTSLAAKDARTYPIYFNALNTQDTTFVIEIPEGFSAKYIPQGIEEDSPWLKVLVEYKREGNKIKFRQKVDSKRKVISQGEYADFKAFLEHLAKKIKQRIVLETKP